MTASSPDYPRPATIQLPSPTGNGAKRAVPCNFSGMEGKRLTLEASEALPISTAVSVEYDDALFLGEVLGCSAGERGFHVEIKVEQILTGLQSLMLLRARLLSEGVPQPLGMMPVGARN